MYGPEQSIPPGRPVSRFATTAFRFRWALLIIGGLALLVAMALIIIDFRGLTLRPEGLLIVGIFLLLQGMFLVPRRGWTIKLADTGRPMLLSIFVASLMMLLVSLGFLLVLAEIGKTDLGINWTLA